MKVTQSQEEIGRGNCRKNQWAIDRPVTGGHRDTGARAGGFAQEHRSARQGSAVSSESRLSIKSYGNRVVFELAYDLQWLILYERTIESEGIIEIKLFLSAGV